MSTGQIGILAAITVYLAAMVYVGFISAKRAAVILPTNSIWEAANWAHW